MVWISQRQSGQPQILMILHQEASSPGRVATMLQEMGFALDIRRPPLGHPLPDTLADHAGAIVFGGPMSANDPHDYVKREIDWIEVPLKENKPFFGICLGAQMLVKHLGGVVTPHEEGVAEIGYSHCGRPAKGDVSCHGPTWPISGTGKDFHCRMAPACWRQATPIRTRRSGSVNGPMACSFMPNLPMQC